MKRYSLLVLLLFLLLPVLTCYMQPVGYDANPSVYSPAGLSFEDRDITVDSIDGDLVIQPAQGEDMIYEYRVYRGTASSREATEIDNLPVTGSPITVNVTQNIAGFTHLVVCGVGSDGIYGDCRRLDVDDLVVEQVFNAGPINVTSVTYLFKVYGDYLYFRGFDPPWGIELWHTDGTIAGTVPTGDLSSAGADGFDGDEIVGFNGEIVFPGKADAPNNGVHLGVYNIASGTLAWEQIGGIGAGTDVNPELFTVMNNILYYSGNSTGDIHYYDGSGTGMVANLGVAPNSTSLHKFNGNIYFDGETPASGKELLKTDGVNTIMVRDINGAGDSNPADFITAFGKLVFTAIDVTNGREVWITDGTVGGTSLIRDINTNAGISSNPESLVYFKEKVYFSANDGIHGKELWFTDGTYSGTQLLKDINSSGDSSPDNLVVIGNRMYFSADNGTDGREIFVTDGTSAGTYMINDIEGGGDSNPREFYPFKGKIYFCASTAGTGEELFATDGTGAGTRNIWNMDGGAGDSSPGEFIEFKNKLYFSSVSGGSRLMYVLYFQ